MTGATVVFVACLGLIVGIFVAEVASSLAVDYLTSTSAPTAVDLEGDDRGDGPNHR